MTAPAVAPGPARPADSAPDPAAGAAWPALLFVAAFGVLLASFPARNGDLWRHLAAGREVAAGAITAATPTWLFDLGAYAAYAAGGGAGVVGVKALAVGGLAVVLLLAGRTGPGWGIPAACTALAVLACGTRLLVQPATASVVFLGLTVWLLRRPGPAGRWPDWRLAVLFAVWANVDRGFLFGLGAVGLTWLGRALDRPAERRWDTAGAFLVLAAVCLLNPLHVRAFAPLAEVVPAIRQARTLADAGQPQGLFSPFQQVYWDAFGSNPAGLAYYPLLGLGLVSFAAARSARRWARFLPWAGLAVASVVQVRTIPLFAAMAGPVLAWNLQDLFAGLATARPVPRGLRVFVGGLTAVTAAAFLVAAWPGLLQRPPYEPRRWAVEEPVALRDAAEVVRRGTADGLWPAGSATLHLTADGLSSDTADAFAWYAPADPRLVDDDLGRQLVEAADPGGRARAAGVGRVVVSAADRGRAEPVMRGLLADPDGWPLVSLSGGVAVFGRRDGEADSYRGHRADLDRLGFDPTEAESAPPAGPDRRPARWWDDFTRPAPPSLSPDRDQARALVMAAEAAGPRSAVRKVRAWDAAQTAGLVGAAGGWAGMGAAADAGFRLALVRPPEPVGGRFPPLTGTVLDLQQGYARVQDDVPPAALYAAVRAARRAVAADPADAAAYQTLGVAYLDLIRLTRERVWGGRLADFGQLRLVQAAAAFARAVALNPGPATTKSRQELVGLYQQLGCLDLAADHLRAYRDLAARSGRIDREVLAGLDRQVERAAEQVGRVAQEFEAEAGRVSVGRRAEDAARRGLGGRALAMLLESDVSAFGATGAEMQLDLLLRTGQPDRVLAGTAVPGVRELLGPGRFHWLRARAAAAAGDYRTAEGELAELSDLEGGVPDPAAVAAAVAAVAGQRVLAGRPAGPGLADPLVRELTRAASEGEERRIAGRLAQQSDGATLRGLLALEEGDTERARLAFRAALAFSPGRAGGLDFPGRRIAREALAWLEPEGR